MHPTPPLNLKTATAQQVFDHVVRHLFTQGRRAMGVDDEGEERCAYRGTGDAGTACAVGCLLSDDFAAWADTLTTSGIGNVLAIERLRNEELMPAALRGEFCDLRDHRLLLRDLQAAHDTKSNWVDPAEMRHVLWGVARDHELSTAVLDEVPDFAPSETPDADESEEI